MKVEALNNYVVFEMIKPPEKDGILITEILEKTPRWGTVISAGPGAYDIDGNLIPPDVKEGDTVYVMAHGNYAIDMDTVKEETINTASFLDLLAKMDMDKMELQPLGSYVEIEKIDPPTESKGGIILTETVRSAPNIARVKKVGLGYSSMSGNKIPFQVAEGDIVAYEPYKTMIIDLAGLGINEQRTIIMQANLLAKINGVEL